MYWQVSEVRSHYLREGGLRGSSKQKGGVLGEGKLRNGKRREAGVTVQVAKRRRNGPSYDKGHDWKLPLIYGNLEYKKKEEKLKLKEMEESGTKVEARSKATGSISRSCAFVKKDRGPEEECAQREKRVGERRGEEGGEQKKREENGTGAPGGVSS